MTDHLLRSHAPIPDEGWKAIDDEARARLTAHLAARKLVDFNGPIGWTHSAIDLGRVDDLAGPDDGIEAQQRRVQALVELRVPFTVARAEVQAAARGADDLELEDLAEAARKLGEAENRLVFHGFPAASITGVTDAASHGAVALGKGADRYPNAVARAVNLLRSAGIAGPFGFAVSPTSWTEIMESTEPGGELLIDHLQRILGGAVVRAPGIEGGVVLSMRGGDFMLESGEDVSVGYRSHDEETIQLYLEESLTFRVLEPDAAVPVTA
jgi:uncharacterized linocin/CFP29 family protein